jgi:hypothetical protein
MDVTNTVEPIQPEWYVITLIFRQKMSEIALYFQTKIAVNGY